MTVGVLAHVVGAVKGRAPYVCIYPMDVPGQKPLSDEGHVTNRQDPQEPLQDLVNRERAHNQELLAITQELEFAQTRLRTVIDSTPEGIVVSDEHGRIILSNPAADHVFGRPR